MLREAVLSTHTKLLFEFFSLFDISISLESVVDCGTSKDGSTETYIFGREESEMV